MPHGWIRKHFQISNKMQFYCIQKQIWMNLDLSTFASYCNGGPVPNLFLTKYLNDSVSVLEWKASLNSLAFTASLRALMLNLQNFSTTAVFRLPEDAIGLAIRMKPNTSLLIIIHNCGVQKNLLFVHTEQAFWLKQNCNNYSFKLADYPRSSKNQT